MLTTDKLTLIRAIAFGISGLMCAAFAVLSLLTPFTLPNWLPLAASVGLATVIFAAFSAGGSRNASAAMDEAYRADNTRAAAFGFWGALIIGLLLWLTSAGGGMQLAITLTGASAIYMLTHVAFEVRGRGWR